MSRNARLSKSNARCPDSITISKEQIIASNENLAHSYAEMLAEAARYALELSAHQPGVDLSINDHKEQKSTRLHWVVESDDLTSTTFTDSNERTKWAAETLSILLLPQLTEWRVGVKSNVGTRLDFYIDSNPLEEELIFNVPMEAKDQHPLPIGIEVTGIERETKNNSISRRRKSKSDNIQKSDIVARGEASVFVAIAELSRPHFQLDTE